MEKHFNSFIESVMLFVFICALSFFAYFLFSDLPSWTVVLTYGFPLFASFEAYEFFKKLRLYVSIIITAGLILIFVVLGIFVFKFPLGLNFILCIQILIAICFSIHIRKNLKHTYYGNFPMTYNRNCSIVFDSCLAFIMAAGGKHAAKIRSSFIDFFNEEFEPPSVFSNRNADTEDLTSHTLNHILLKLASSPRYYQSRKDDDSWFKSDETLVGSLFLIYQRSQYYFENRKLDFFEKYEFLDFNDFGFADVSKASYKCREFICLVNDNYEKDKPPILTPDEQKALREKRIHEAEQRILPF